MTINVLKGAAAILTLPVQDICLVLIFYIAYRDAVCVKTAIAVSSIIAVHLSACLDVATTVNCQLF